jgi:hypothetical protein
MGVVSERTRWRRFSMTQQRKAPNHVSTERSHVGSGAASDDAVALPGAPGVVVAMPAGGFLPPARLACLLGISTRTLQGWHAARICPPRCKIGNLILYAAASVRDWLDAAERSPGQGHPESARVNRLGSRGAL